MNPLKKVLLITAAACALVGNANAFVTNGNLGPAGYDTIGFSTAGGLVDMQFNAGPFDSVFSLFDGSGVHIITNDDDYDANSLNSHITQILGAGNYSLLVSYYSTPLNLMTFSSNSYGGNSGDYYTSAVTLVGLQNYLDANPNTSLDGAGYIVDITNAAPNAVPEPGSLALLGLGLVALQLRRRRGAAN